MSGGPLAGRRVVVTRAAGQGGTLVTALEALGACVIEMPLIRTVEPEDRGASLAAALRGIEGFDWIVVTSANGSRALLHAAGGSPRADHVSVGCVGPASAAVLEHAGWRVSLVAEQHSAAGLVDAFPACTDSARCRVLHVAGDRADRTIHQGLTRRGWQVQTVVGYRTQVVEPSQELRARVAEADAIAFMSGSAVEAFVQLVGIGAIPSAVFSIGASTTAVAERLGVTVTATASKSVSECLAQCVADRLQ